MLLFEYILVALLGSGSAPSAPPTVTLGADAIVQPNGQVFPVDQPSPSKDCKGCPNKEKNVRKAIVRHRRAMRRRHRR